MQLANLLFSFKGRVARLPFWISQAAAGVIIGVMYDLDSEDCYCAVGLVLLWPLLAIEAKRWHDRDKSAWWLLINLIPIIGPIWALVECGFLRGTTGLNRYGPDPLPPVSDAV
jgi:uncharacterized membrane protein YhaH (DUF805 family)